LQRLAVEDTDADPGDVLAGLARVAANAAVERLNRLAQQGGDPAALATTIGWLQQTREQLGAEDLRSEATEALVAWLALEAEGGEGTT
jgi:hypothetical protein